MRVVGPTEPAPRIRAGDHGSSKKNICVRARVRVSVWTYDIQCARDSHVICA